MTKRKYGNQSDIAVTLNLILDKVRLHFFKNTLLDCCGGIFLFFFGHSKKNSEQITTPIEKNEKVTMTYL